MKHRGVRPILPIPLLLPILLLAACATLPDVKSIIAESYLFGRPPDIVDAEGRLSDATEIRLAEWKKRPLARRLREWFGHLIRHWL